MRKFRSTVALLLTSLLLLAAVPASAAEEMKMVHCTGLSIRQMEETETTRIERRFSASICGTGNDMTSGASLTEFIFEDGVRRVRQHPVTDVSVTVAPNLATAQLSGFLLDGTPISAVLTATGKAVASTQHPDPWSTGFDGVDGVLVSVTAAHSRPAEATLTVGETTGQFTGSIWAMSSKTETNEGQEPKEHQPAPERPAH
jgi:hypothetical protein